MRDLALYYRRKMLKRDMRKVDSILADITWKHENVRLHHGRYADDAPVVEPFEWVHDPRRFGDKYRPAYKYEMLVAGSLTPEQMAVCVDRLDRLKLWGKMVHSWRKAIIERDREAEYVEAAQRKRARRDREEEHVDDVAGHRS